MKERFLDVIKWGLILIIAGAVFYVVYPKYYFDHSERIVWTRGNKMTGKVEVFVGYPKNKWPKNKWFDLGEYKPF